MVLHPLEFSDCFLDPPWFRQSIKEHEDELEHTNTQIKQLIKDAKAMLLACRKQGEMMSAFSERLTNFQFEIIGDNLTDAEKGIAGSLKEFGTMLQEIESEWLNTIERSEIQLIQPLESFRKDHIHSYREAKKTFDKSSDRYYKQMEQTLGLSHKKKEQQLTDSDNELLVQKKVFHKASLEYVYKLQEVQERKKFEFVEHLLMFMQVYFNFFKQTHETAVDCKEYMTDIQQRLISTRNQYEGTRTKTQTLMKKMMADPSASTRKGSQTHSPQRVIGQRWARAGYLYLLEKNALGARFAAKWTRFFCMYTKENKLFQMLSTSSHTSSHTTVAPVKIGSSNHLAFSGDPLIVLSCTRRQTDSIDKRFCFDIEVEDSAGKQYAFTLQALSMSDRKKWIGAMDGKEPNYTSTREYRKPEEFTLNETSIKFVKDVIAEIERRGIDAEGIYRLVGVSSKVDRLLQIAMDPSTYGIVKYADDVEWELNTLTSALKNFFRNLPEPIMTFDLHEDFIAAAKREDPDERLNRVIMLIKKLAPDSRLVLELLIHHLVNVASRWETNKMTVQNIGVCFGPTLMRPKQETVQSIMEIKFNNIIVEILIENCDAIFGSVDGDRERKAISHRPVDSRPSMKFKYRPKTFQRRSRSPFQETLTEDVQSTPTQGGGVSPRFQRGHAIRGVPGRSTIQKPPDIDQNTDNDDEVLSDNTDEFGRMSPLDLNLDFEHFSLNPPQSYVNLQPKTQPINPPMEERVKKEEWDPDTAGKSFSGRREPFRRNVKLSQSDRTGNTGRNVNQNNSSCRQNNIVSSVEEAKEMLSREVAPMKQALLSKKRSVVKRELPLQSKKPEVYVNHSVRAERPAGIANFEKLRETFQKGEHSNEEKVGETGDHDASFLWPKPGGIRGNSYVEASTLTQTRPRSTVVSSRDEARSSSSSVPQTPDDSEKRVVSAPVTPVKSRNRICQALYSCEAEHDSELSFQQGDMIFNVTQSEEPGWLLGTLNGHTGLIPENYVQEKLWE